jgi:NAD(P)-dependent dehydrogenase (short-subunit alcohol dehydrogenase family)
MANYFDLTGRFALVTGAAGGIGSAVAEALADAGAAVLVTDLDKDAAAAVAERISANGGRAESAALDVSDRESADATAAQAAGLTDGALHIVINNAGVTKPAMFDKTTQESFRLLFDIHVMGSFNVTQAALPYIPTDGTGRIVNVTSAAGLTGTLGQVNYSAAKACIIGFTKSLAREAHPADLGHPHPTQPAVETLDVVRFDRHLPESLMYVGFAPGQAAVRSAEKVAHRLGEVPQRLLLHGLRASSQPVVFGAGRGQLSALLAEAGRLPSGLPVLVLLDGEVPHVPGVATMLGQHRRLLGGRKQPKSRHASNVATTTDKSPKGAAFAPGYTLGFHAATTR